MSNFKWSPELDTGIEIIDKQHRRIFEYIVALEDIQQDDDREELGRIIEQLVDYTLSHFTFEEGLLEESGYRFINAHKKVHELFIRRVNDYVKRFRSGEDISFELSATLKTWLINHIKNDDSDYVETVQKNIGGAESKATTWLKSSLKKAFG